MAVESPKPVKDPHYHLKENSLTVQVFFGDGAKELGIHGKPIDEATYINLFHGYRTNDNGERGEKIPKYMHPSRRGAFEFITTDPKDVSIAGEVGGDSRIEGIRLEARKAVTDYITKHAKVKATKKDDPDISRQPGNLIMVWHDHPANREGDPHRHGHLIVMNLCSDHKQGIWKGLELRYIQMPKLAKIYRDAMRKGLNQAGYKTAPEGKEYRIVGVPSEIKGVFSRRNVGIKEKVAEFEGKKGKVVSAEGKRRFGAFDRPEKPDDMPLPARRANWLSQLTDGQVRAVDGLVQKAKRAVTSLRFKTRIAKHMRLVRSVSRDEGTPERGIDSGRSR